MEAVDSASLYDTIEKGIHVEMLSRETYHEPSGEFLPRDRYDVRVSIPDSSTDLTAFLDRCILRRRTSTEQQSYIVLDIRRILAHRLNTLLHLNGLPNLRKHRVSCVGMVDREPVPTEAIVVSEVARKGSGSGEGSGGGEGELIPSTEARTVHRTVVVDVCVSIVGPSRLNTMLLNNPDVLSRISQCYAIAVPNWRESGNVLRIVRVMGSARKCVLQVDLDRMADRPRLRAFKPQSLVNELSRFNKFYLSSTLHRTASTPPPLHIITSTPSTASLDSSTTFLPPTCSSVLSSPMTPTPIMNCVITPPTPPQALKSPTQPIGASPPPAKPLSPELANELVFQMLSLSPHDISVVRNASLENLTSGTSKAVAMANQGATSRKWWLLSPLFWGSPVPVAYAMHLMWGSGLWLALGTAAAVLMGFLTFVSLSFGLVTVKSFSLRTGWRKGARGYSRSKEEWKHFKSDIVDEVYWYCESGCPTDPNAMHCFAIVITQHNYVCIEQVPGGKVSVQPFESFESALETRKLADGSASSCFMYAHAQAIRDKRNQPALPMPSLLTWIDQVESGSATAAFTNSVAFAQELFVFCCHRGKAAPTRPWWLSQTPPITPTSHNSTVSVSNPTLAHSAPTPGVFVAKPTASPLPPPADSTSSSVPTTPSSPETTRQPHRPISHYHQPATTSFSPSFVLSQQQPPKPPSQHNTSFNSSFGPPGSTSSSALARTSFTLSDPDLWGPEALALSPIMAEPESIIASVPSPEGQEVTSQDAGEAPLRITKLRPRQLPKRSSIEIPASGAGGLLSPSHEQTAVAVI